MDTNSQQRIAESVRALSAAFGDRQEDVANVLGITQNTVSRKLRGLTRWSVEDVERISEHYKVPPSMVLAGPRAWFDALRSRWTQGDGSITF